MIRLRATFFKRDLVQVRLFLWGNFVRGLLKHGWWQVQTFGYDGYTRLPSILLNCSIDRSSEAPTSISRNMGSAPINVSQGSVQLTCLKHWREGLSTENPFRVSNNLSCIYSLKGDRLSPVERYQSATWPCTSTKRVFKILGKLLTSHFRKRCSACREHGFQGIYYSSKYLSEIIDEPVPCTNTLFTLISHPLQYFPKDKCYDTKPHSSLLEIVLQAVIASQRFVTCD